MSFLGALNTCINYASGNEPSSSAAQLYPNAVFTALQGRTFGTWTSISAAVRLQAAYDIKNKGVYELALFTLLAAVAHFCLEWLWFGTMTTKTFMQTGGVVDVLSLAWMALGWSGGWYFS